jgi:hypothetical protein
MAIYNGLWVCFVDFGNHTTSAVFKRFCFEKHIRLPAPKYIT